MINLLILYELNRTPLTMYGISKQIRDSFSVLLKLSMGTLQPALKTLERKGYVNSQKYMSSGGRPSICYAITENGRKYLNEELLSEFTDNPVQFLVEARIRLCCAEKLTKDEFRVLLKLLKQRTEILMLEANKTEKSDYTSNFSRIIFDNLSCEYKNFLLLLEGLEHACHS